MPARTPRTVLSCTALLALVVSPLAMGLSAPAQAYPASTGLVISEIFGANSASAVYNQDYVEISNPTGAPISTAGMSVQYRASASTATSSKVDLPDALIPAGGTFLVGGAATTPVTTAATISPDASNNSMNLSGTAGVVALLSTQTQPFTIPAGSDPASLPAAIVDLVGYGTTPTTYETTRAPAPTTTAGGNPVLNRVRADSNINGTDFAAAATGSPTPCTCTAPAGLKISEVYTDGDQGAPGYDHDFVELQNAGTSALSMSGLTLQYRAPGATGPGELVATLTGTMAAGTYDLVQLAGTTGNGSALPVAPEYTGTLDLPAAGGTLFIAKATSAFDPGSGAVARDQYRGDLVGWGSSNTFETTVADATDLARTTSLTRAPGGVDTDVNSDDFTVGASTPNAAPVIPTFTIAQIQGTGPATPVNNAIVKTSGVVTAVYPSGTGQFGGFYVQTGGSNDPDASDGIFVFMGSKASPALGASVQVAGKVTEFAEMTEITPATAGDVTTIAALPAPVVATSVPGAACTITASTTDCLSGAALAAAREKREGELLSLTGTPFTVSDSYDGTPWSQPSSRASQMAGEIGLAANSGEPLYLPIERHSPRLDPAGHAARGVFNEAHRITLDDGVNVNYSSTTGSAFPWLRVDHTVRVGADVTFAQPMIFDYRNDLWKLQPQTPVAAGEIGTTQGIAFQQDRPAAPQPVGGNLKIATFNMLNYFVHPAQDWDNLPNDANGTDRTCTYYTDRGSEKLTANTCTWTDTRTDPDTLLAPGPRGAATAASFSRQEAKEIAAINTMAADVMSLEEVENATKLGYADRDAALERLVSQLNAAWPDSTVDSPRWAFVPSPRPEAQPTILEQDAIRSAFIYNPRVVKPVGRSEILVNSAPFRNAREPLAQAFQHVDGTRNDGFVVIVNHLKSKSGPTAPSVATGDNADQGDGAGFYNGDRLRQVKALDVFAKSVSEDKGIPAVFLTGDFNAYAQEDPILALEGAGWKNLEPSNGESSYSFGGLAGSLDHVFANPAAAAMTNDQTIWPINANESVLYEYSRYNYNVTNLYDASPYRASDHNPEIIGINAPISTTPAADTIQILASNDFHGRLLDDPASASAGAAAMAGAVKGLRAANPDTAFVMAGDIVGASTFESFIQRDKPTLDAMNEAGLEVSAAGNHEFDRGYDDLMNRIMASYDATTNPEGGANWPYIAANVRTGSAAGDYALRSDRTDGNFAHANGATWWKDFPDLNGGNGIRVGFVGAVTEDLDSLVAPSSIQGLAITSVVDEVNAAADTLKANGCGNAPCDLVIELVHEGAPSPSCATIGTDTTSTFGKIVHGANSNVDAIISGHTHLKYNCKVDVVGKAVPRPVVSAGQYGSYLNQLEFEFTPGTDELARIRQHVLAMKDYDEDAATKAIVSSAVDVAAVKGADVLGQVAGPFKRARRVDEQGATVENRGGESTLGNQVAEIQRWKTQADIGIMNPGGLRADLIGTDEGPGPVTYREAADVQPFANTLVTVDLTGAQVKLLLEQQWQRDPDNNIPSRPFLRLGTSKGFTWTEDSSRSEGDRITGMFLHGTAIDPTATYTVSANSFLATGGDNFRALTLGTRVQDTGFTDLQATVDYLAQFDASTPLPVDFAQHGVGARVPVGPYSAGQTVTVPVDSLSMTGEGDLTDTSVYITLGQDTWGPFAVTTALPATPYDIPGAATVSFPLPSGLSGGTQWFTLEGRTTGTVAKVPVQVIDTRVTSTVSGTAQDITWGEDGSVSVTVTPPTSTGTVELYDGTTKIGEGTLAGDATTIITVPAGTLGVGEHTLTLKYLGDVDTKPSQGSVVVTVVKASSSVSGTAAGITWGQAGSTSVTVAPAAATGTVELYDGTTLLDDADLTSGAATLTIAAKALAVGDHALTLKYLGDGHYTASQSTVDVTVVKATSTVTATPTPASVVQDSGTSNIAVAVTAPNGVVPTGPVSAWLGGTRLATATLANGQATLVVGPFATVGQKSVEIRYEGSTEVSGDIETVTVTVTARPTPQPVATTVTGTDTTVQWARAGTVTVSVAPAAATGTVELYDGTTRLGAATLSGGAASIPLAARSLEVGTHTLVVKYLGSASHAASQDTVTVTMTKARPKVRVTKPEAIDAGDKAKITVGTEADGFVPTGQVRIVLTKVGGTKRITVTRTLDDGTAVAKVRVDRVGRYRVTVTYLGDAHTLRGADSTHLRVR